MIIQTTRHPPPTHLLSSVHLRTLINKCISLPLVETIEKVPAELRLK